MGDPPVRDALDRRIADRVCNLDHGRRQLDRARLGGEALRQRNVALDPGRKPALLASLRRVVFSSS